MSGNGPRESVPEINSEQLFDALHGYCQKHGAIAAFDLREYGRMTKTMAAKGKELAELVPMCTVFFEVNPTLLFNYSVLKRILKDLNSRHHFMPANRGDVAAGDMANSLMICFNHFRRVFRDQIKWNQATEQCTDVQLASMAQFQAAYADQNEGPRIDTAPQRQADQGHLAATSSGQPHAPKPRELLARASEVSLDSDGLPALKFMASPQPQPPRRTVASPKKRPREITPPEEEAELSSNIFHDAAATSPLPPQKKDLKTKMHDQIQRSGSATAKAKAKANPKAKAKAKAKPKAKAKAKAMANPKAKAKAKAKAMANPKAKAKAEAQPDAASDASSNSQLPPGPRKALAKAKAKAEPKAKPKAQAKAKPKTAADAASKSSVRDSQPPGVEVKTKASLRDESSSFGIIRAGMFADKSYIQQRDSDGKWRLIVAVTNTQCEDHHSIITRLFQFCKGSGLSKPLVIAKRDSILMA